MTETDLFGAYVRDRLEKWGREFAYHRDRFRAGGYGRNILDTSPMGSGPEPNLEALQIEDIVRGIYKRGEKTSAWALRAYYCGSGRRAVERLDLYRAFIGRRTGLRQYYEQIRAGTDSVRAELIRVCRDVA